MNEWISVDDRLPDDGNDVLCIKVDGNWTHYFVAQFVSWGDPNTQFFYSRRRVGGLHSLDAPPRTAGGVR